MSDWVKECGIAPGQTSQRRCRGLCHRVHMDRRGDTRRREGWCGRRRRVLRYSTCADATSLASAAAGTAATVGGCVVVLRAVVSAQLHPRLLCPSCLDLHGFEQALRLQAALGVGCDKECQGCTCWFVLTMPQTGAGTGMRLGREQPLCRSVCRNPEVSFHLPA